MRRYVLSIGAVLIGIVVSTVAVREPATTPDPPPQALSDTLQTRPLRFLMVGLGQDMSRIGDGIWHEDYEMIRQGARSIADHPRVTTEEVAAIKQALGDQFGSFVGFDQFVHDAADELAEAATQGDMGRVLTLHNRLQQGCVSCHTSFRTRVRTALY